jgi:hypothetical protein
LLKDGGIIELLGGCDYGTINWFPNTRRFVKTCGVETTELADSGAENTLLKPTIPKGLVKPYKVALHYGMCFEPLNSALEGLRYISLKWMPPLLKEGIFDWEITTSHAVGFSHRMVSSKLIDNKDKFFTNDWELAIPFSRAQEALQAVSEFALMNGIYLPLVGVFLRFAHSKDGTFLAHTVSAGAFDADEAVMFVEFPTPAPTGFSKTMTKEVNRPYEELAQMLITEFDARPHWGKNKLWAHQLEIERGAFDDNLAHFEAVRAELDPESLFRSDYLNAAGL